MEKFGAFNQQSRKTFSKSWINCLWNATSIKFYLDTTIFYRWVILGSFRSFNTDVDRRNYLTRTSI